MLNLVDRNFEQTITNILKELTEHMFKKIKENTIFLNEQLGNIFGELKTIENKTNGNSRSEKKILKWKEMGVLTTNLRSQKKESKQIYKQELSILKNGEK